MFPDPVLTIIINGSISARAIKRLKASKVANSISVR
jgi:hypothetical protein